MTQIKILERYDQTKQVTAWGEVWTVPVWCEWMMISGNGTIICNDSPHENYKPKAPGWNTNYWLIAGCAREFCDVEFEGSWRESLVYVGDQ